MISTKLINNKFLLVIMPCSQFYKASAERKCNLVSVLFLFIVAKKNLSNEFMFHLSFLTEKGTSPCKEASDE
jgi:hypothetical protein